MPTPPASVRAALLGALLALVTTSPVAAVEAQGIRMDPSEPSALGAGSVLRPALPPGGAATYDLVLHNQHDTAVEVLVYGADLTAAGEVASGTDNRGVGAWVEAVQPRVALEPNGATVVAVTVTRPAGDSQGGTGAIVTQLSEQSRQDLGLGVIRRAALRVEVAADGSGDGVHVEVTGQDPSGGLVPGVLTVEVTATNPGDHEVAVDQVLHVLRPLVDDPSHRLGGSALGPGEQVTQQVEVELPWYGLIGRLQAEAASLAVTTSSAPVRVIVVPPWVVLPLLLAAGWGLLWLRRSDRSFTLGRVPGGGDDDDGGDTGGGDRGGDGGNDGDDGGTSSST